MNRKCVEGLPLKYIIIVLVAVLVIDLILEMTGVIEGGIMSSLADVVGVTLNASSNMTSP